MHALLLAMAMQETTHMDVRQRDATKDGDPKARNATIFNLSAVSPSAACSDSAVQVFLHF